MKTAIIIDTRREGYGVDQIRDTMTVGDLIALLQELDDDMPIYTGHDNRYTYGGLRPYRFNEVEFDDDGCVVSESEVSYW